MAHDLTVMRQKVEQLAVKQEQMAHNIASLQAVGQDIKQKMPSPPLPPAASLPPRKNAPGLRPRSRPRAYRYWRTGQSETPATATSLCRVTATPIGQCPAHRCPDSVQSNRSSGKTATGWW